MAPAPPPAVPDEAHHVAVAIRVAEDGTQEVGDALLPLLGYEVGVLEEFLEDADVEERLAGLLRPLLEAAEVLLAAHEGLVLTESEDSTHLREIDGGDVLPVGVLDCVEFHERGPDRIVHGEEGVRRDAVETALDEVLDAPGDKFRVQPFPHAAEEVILLPGNFAQHRIVGDFRHDDSPVVSAYS